MSKTDRLLMCRWAFTGLTHIMIEGPFVFTPDFFKKENPNFFDEVCKFLPASPGKRIIQSEYIVDELK